MEVSSSKMSIISCQSRQCHAPERPPYVNVTVPGSQITNTVERQISERQSSET